MIRLFVGLGFPNEIRDALAAARAAIAGARWTDPDNFHLTLRFIGDVPEEAFPRFRDAFLGVRGARFELRLSGLGVFGEPDRPNVLWAGVEPSAALARLQIAVERAMVDAGLPPDTRPHAPHVTLARLGRASAEGVEGFFEEWGAFSAGPFQVERINLYRSLSMEGRRVHRPIEVLSLTPSSDFP